VPLRNRVDPFGELIATPERGTLFGNRGVLHADDGTIVRRHALQRWIYCRLEFKGRRRKLLQPGRYTELFFLDEATALAAGHRPCAECMRERFNQFRAAWNDSAPISAPDLDAALHAERLTADRTQATWRSRLGDLPDGTMVFLDETPHLVRARELLPWSFAGYGDARAADPASEVEVLTPPSTVRALAFGFSPYSLGA
jgi:hypothetical protein